MIRVTGGLVVPLFVVVLSLLGGSISMTRKLPEIQKRAAPAYEMEYRQHLGRDGKNEEGWLRPITPVEGRDMLIFQILQVITAPLLAIVAYSSIEPESVTAAVLIGFGSGFASEPLLLYLREKIDAVIQKRAKEAKIPKKFADAAPDPAAAAETGQDTEAKPAEQASGAPDPEAPKPQTPEKTSGNA
ncbi:hypothetical protein [Mangrovicoccus ximenensis]|uniref:hypothetical protein n=1 Tax=Mangrovicoccus ximenensis TaxID=1911570 RepID=UPI000D3944C7|nr:hypothetical protein [Mangrovicoccus ximenensis]